MTRARSLRILAWSLGFSGLFWVLDAVYDYYTFPDVLHTLIFHEPLTFWDSLILNVPQDDILARCSFLVACLIGGLLVARHVRRLERSEAELRGSEERSRLLYENALAGLYGVGPDGRLITINTAFARMFGFEGPGMCLAAFTSAGGGLPEGSGQWAEAVRRALDTGEPQSLEHTAVTRDGEPIWLLHSLQAVRGEDGAVSRLECSVVNITHRKKAEEYGRLLSQELVRIQERERRRLALELHDNHAQDLAALKLGLATLCDAHPEMGRALAPGLERCGTILDGAIRNVRGLMRGLQPYELEHIGLADMVGNHVQAFARQTGLDVSYEKRGLEGLDLDRLDREDMVHIFRIVQESLTNVQRHARASRVRVALEHKGGDIALSIQDDGRGFDPAEEAQRVMPERRVGLLGLRERADILGAVLGIDSLKGRGTTIRLRVPLAGRAGSGG